MSAFYVVFYNAYDYYALQIGSDLSFDAYYRELICIILSLYFSCYAYLFTGVIFYVFLLSSSTILCLCFLSYC